MSNVKKSIIIFTLFLLCAFIVLHILVVSSSSFQEPEKSDSILVLGYGLIDGEYPDEWLEYRLKKGLELYNNGYGKYIIVSGGKGPKDNIPVAYAMKKWLVDKGVPVENILVEDKAINTYENIVFSKSLMELNDIKSVVVVTSDFHIFRSMLISRNHLENVSGASSHSEGFIKKTLSYIREDIAVLKYLIFKK
ncbi:UNVERIFIED_CONTAM: uncharacterized SAM-binding protein YcdF (DUF218 family) [Acetivibrio alkalicellulosi]